MITVTEPSDHYQMPDDKVDGLARVISIIDGAKHSLYCILYVLAHPLIKDAIKRAVARGVDVQVIFDATELHVDLPELAELFAAGLPRDHVDSGTSEEHSLVHDKIVVADESVVIEGSTNLTTKGFAQDQNLIVTTCAALAQAYIAKFTRLRAFIRSTEPQDEAKLDAIHPTA